MTREKDNRPEFESCRNAVAQQTLEGLHVPLDVVKEMKRAARGEIKIEAGMRSTLLRLTYGNVRGERPLP